MFQLKNPQSQEDLFRIACNALHAATSEQYPAYIDKVIKITLTKIADSKREGWAYSKTVDELIIETLQGFTKASIETRDGKIFQHVASEILRNSTITYPTPIGCDCLFVVEFQGRDVLIALEIKSGWNWANSTSLPATQKRLVELKPQLQEMYGMPVLPVIGVCSSQKTGKKDSHIANGVWHIYGRLFWGLVANWPGLYDKIFPVMGLIKEDLEPICQELLRLKHAELFEQVKRLTTHQFLQQYKPAEMLVTTEQAFEGACESLLV